MLRDTEEIDALKSDEFKKLKTDKEELLPGSYNTEAIKGVQSFLNKEGYTDKKGDKLKTDGVYGANTANSVMKYQSLNGLSVDGIVGDETWNSIYKRKKKREEKSSGKNPYIEAWIKNYNPLANNKKDDGESFHERVRNGWESRTNPKSTVNSRSLRAPENAFLQAPSRIPERYISKTELPRKAELFANDFEPDYPAFKESDFPDYHLFSNSAGGKNTQPESDNEWDAAETKVETEAVEGGVIRPGYNAKGEWSQDPDADNYGKDSAKYGLLTVFDKSWKTANDASKRNLSAISINLRKFDDLSINRAYYLNDRFGAAWQGHTAVLLVNKHGDGILFSYGAATGDFFDGPARMNVGIYDKKGTDKLLNNQEVFVISNSGSVAKENYGRKTDYNISAEDGYKMFRKAVEIMEDMENYDVLKNNCDQIATEIFYAGGINILSLIRPNWTYELERGIDFVHDIVKGE